MRKELHKTVIICIWGGLLILPGIAMLLGIGDIYTINENRYKAEMPRGSIVQAFRDDGEYCKAVEATFNDNFGFRDLLIRCKNQINYSVFRYSPELYFGEDGYFSYYNVVANQQVYDDKLEFMQLQGIVEKIETLDLKLKEKNIELVTMFPPQKNTAFPEIGKNFPVKRKNPNSYELFMELISKSKVKDANIELVPLLRKANEKAPVFHRTDFHWNDWGGACGFGTAVDEFAKAKNSSIRFDWNLLFSDLELENMGQAQSIPTIIPIKEKSITVNKSQPLTCVYEYMENPPITLLCENSVQSSLGGALVVIGDSYAGYGINSYNGTNAGICDYFDKVYFIHVNDSKGMLNHLPDDTEYVIFESIEVSMPILEKIITDLWAEPKE